LRAELRARDVPSLKGRATQAGATPDELAKAEEEAVKAERADAVKNGRPADVAVAVGKAFAELIIRKEMNQPGCLACSGCAKVAADMPTWDVAAAAGAGGPRLQRTPSGHAMGFGQVIQAADKTLLVMEPWYNPRLPTQVWCLFECYTTIAAGGPDAVEVALGAKQQRGMLLGLQHRFEALEATVGSIDARQAEATMAADRTNIFGAIRRPDD
jgi:hypothetical protein